MSQQIDVNPVLDAMPGRKVPMAVTAASALGILWGLAAFGYGMGTGKVAWTWGATLVAIMWTLGISQGGVLFGIMLTGTWGRWGRPLKRIGESFAFFLPVGYVALLVFLLAGITIYPWNPDTIIEGGPIALAPHNPQAPAAKEIWLTKNFFISRQLIGLLVLMALDFLYIKASLGPDMLMARQRLGDKVGGFLWNIFEAKGDLKQAVDAGQNLQSRIFPFIAFLYALVFSMLAFDLIMSLAPWWFTNMFGGWIFVSSFWTSMAMIAVVSMLGRDWLNLGGFVKQNVTHDLGKLMLAACMFWAYTLYAQLLPIWYANMPEETEFLLIRMFLPQWNWLAQVVAVMCFLAPFTILLSRGVKKMRYPFAAVGLLILTGIFLERSLLVMPSIYKGDTFPFADFLIINFGIWAGFAGAFALVVTNVLARIPPMVVSDPYLPDHPWDVHVHSLDAHH